MLSRDGGNVKALYRAGQAHLVQSDFIEAEAVIRKGLAEEPSNSSLRALLKEYKQKVRFTFRTSGTGSFSLHLCAEFRTCSVLDRRRLADVVVAHVVVFRVA